MSKFNTRPLRNSGPVQSTSQQTITFEGGPAFLRDAKSELFLATVSSLVEDTFYESVDARSTRIQHLIAQIAIQDPEWIRDLVHWLRNSGNLRSIGIVVAAYAVSERLKAKQSGFNRQIVSAALRRADEPGEFLGLWTNLSPGPIPSAVKRGISDALRDSLNEKSYLKWRGKGSRGNYSFRDLLNLTHVKPKDAAQEELFKYIINTAYKNEEQYDRDLLPVIAGRDRFLALDENQRKTVLASPTASQDLPRAGITWESLAGIMEGLDARAWEVMIPSMGYTALRMNLRNFVEAGVSKDVLSAVAKRLADKDEVAKAGILPMQYLAAYQNAPDFFKSALEEGLKHSLQNVPSLKGRTLILVDRSASMFWATSARGSLTYADSAGIFGAALAKRAENADLVVFGSGSEKVHFHDRNILSVVDGMDSLGGTETRSALRTNYAGHDRVIILTDEQTSYWGYSSMDVFHEIVPETVPTFTWNLAGYEAAQSKPSPYRHSFGGLTDSGFQLIPLLEGGKIQDWSFLKE